VQALLDLERLAARECDQGAEPAHLADHGGVEQQPLVAGVERVQAGRR
jgi:hypothetical protein